MGPDRLSIQAFLDDLEASFRQASQRGEVASYIPELATVDPGYFGISVCLPDGSVLRRRYPKTLLDPEHFQGIFFGDCLGSRGRSSVEAGRA